MPYGAWGLSELIALLLMKRGTTRLAMADVNFFLLRPPSSFPGAPIGVPEGASSVSCERARNP
jgi:hypothetical protein